jgi:hypothetical protein
VKTTYTTIESRLVCFLFFIIIFSFLHLLTCVYIFCAASLPTPHFYPSAFRLNLFHPLLWFCWRENIRDNKKDILFLLVWDKNSYTERFLTLLACTCELWPALVHFYQTSPLLLGLLPIGASVNLRLLYSLLNREHINHIQVSGFLSFPYFSCVCSPLSVWPMSNNITAFVLDL